MKKARTKTILCFFVIIIQSVSVTVLPLCACFFLALNAMHNKIMIPFHHRRRLSSHTGMKTRQTNDSPLPAGNNCLHTQRLFGVGIDQVVHMEVVLPNGVHVRFGPTAWEEKKGYPRVTHVSGYCNAAPLSNDEAKWEWVACDA
jgi:hypothetical protein